MEDFTTLAEQLNKDLFDMNPTQDLDKYIGDIVGGLIREAAMLRSKIAYLESIIESQKQQLNKLPKAEEEYIFKEPTT